jgi:hypothetical protein
MEFGTVTPFSDRIYCWCGIHVRERPLSRIVPSNNAQMLNCVVRRGNNWPTTRFADRLFDEGFCRLHFSKFRNSRAADFALRRNGTIAESGRSQRNECNHSKLWPRKNKRAQSQKRASEPSGAFGFPANMQNRKLIELERGEYAPAALSTFQPDDVIPSIRQVLKHL